jgi:hypothetical protein
MVGSQTETEYIEDAVVGSRGTVIVKLGRWAANNPSPWKAACYKMLHMGWERARTRRWAEYLELFSIHTYFKPDINKIPPRKWCTSAVICSNWYIIDMYLQAV